MVTHEKKTSKCKITQNISWSLKQVKGNIDIMEKVQELKRHVMDCKTFFML